MLNFDDGGYNGSVGTPSLMQPSGPGTCGPSTPGNPGIIYHGLKLVGTSSGGTLQLCSNGYPTAGDTFASTNPSYLLSSASSGARLVMFSPSSVVGYLSMYVGAPNSAGTPWTVEITGAVNNEDVVGCHQFATGTSSGMNVNFLGLCNANTLRITISAGADSQVSVDSILACRTVANGLPTDSA